MAEIVAVCLSREKHVSKQPVEQGMLVPDLGLEGDAHAGSERQLSLLGEESMAEMQAAMPELRPGAFAENLTVRGLPLEHVRVGLRLEVGEGALLEITQIGKRCHARCHIFRQVGHCVMPRDGLFAKVLRGGPVRPGDPVRLLRA